MQITAATTTMSSRSTESTPASGPAPDAPVKDTVALHRVAVLLTMLENKPEVRADVVARGRALASDPNYPPPSVINQLADLVVGDR